MAFHDIEEVRRRLKLSADEVADIYVPFVEGRAGRAATLAEVLADPLASYQQIFDTVWTNDSWVAEDYDAALYYALRHTTEGDEKLSALNRLTLIGAVGVAAVRHYDVRKMHFLFDVVDGVHAEENIRAVLFILLVEAQYPGSIRSDFYFQLRMEHFRTIPQVWFLFFLVQACLIAVAVSPELSASYDEEMQAKAIQGIERAKEMGDATNEELMMMLDDDPKLQKFRDDMLSILHRMIKLRCLGADVGYSTFAQAFGEIEFFDEAANWFCPFSNDHPLLFNINNAQRFLSFMADSKSCNTDRFVLLLSIPDGMPEIKIIRKDRETSDEINIEGEDADEILQHVIRSTDVLRQKRELPLAEIPRFLLFTVVAECVHDTFRFYSLYLPQTSDTNNPFGADIDFWRKPVEAPIFARKNEHRTFANWLFECGRYAEAAELYSNILADFDVEDENPDYDLSDIAEESASKEALDELVGFEESEGYSYDEELGADALETIGVVAEDASSVDIESGRDDNQSLSKVEATRRRQAELYRRLGQCLEHLGNSESAADNYRKALCLNPDDEETMQRLADYYRNAEQWAEAQPLLEALYTKVLLISEDAKRKKKDVGRELRLARHLAEAYIHLDRYAEAIPLLSKINYLCPSHKPTMRALALSYVVCCEYDKAERLYRTLIADEHPTSDDLYAAGHCALLLDDIDLAVERYKASLALRGQTCAEADFFGDERPFLVIHGVDPVMFEYAIDLINI